MTFLVLGQILNMGGPCSADLDRDDRDDSGRVHEVTLVFMHVWMLWEHSRTYPIVGDGLFLWRVAIPLRGE